MSRKNRVRALVAPAAVMAVLAGSLGFVSAPAMADDPPAVPSCTITLVSGDPSKAAQPSCGDVSGTDQDWFMFPYGGGNYYVDGRFDQDNPPYYDRAYATEGASVVQVWTDYWDDHTGSRLPGPVWDLAFDTSVTGTQADNLYGMKLGVCGEVLDGYTPAWGTVFNVDDESDRTVSVYVEPRRSDGWGPVMSYNVAFDVADGSSADIPLGYHPPDLAGLLPGFYTVSFYEWDEEAHDAGRLLTVLRQQWVPACGDEEPPDGNQHIRKPKAHLLRTAVHRMRAVLVKGEARRVRFRITVDPPRGATTVRRLKVTAPRKAVVLRDLRFGTRVKVRAYYKGSWHTLAAKRLTA